MTACRYSAYESIWCLIAYKLDQAWLVLKPIKALLACWGCLMASGA